MMSKALLIKNVRILDASQNLDQEGEILILDGKVETIEKPGQISHERAEKIMDGSGKWLLPGLVDVHVHLREPGQEYKATIKTGTEAAVAGGVTSVACMANTNPVNDSPYVTAYIREKAKETGVCRVFPIGAVTKGLKGEELSHIGGMVEEGAVAISDDGKPVMNSYLMRKAMDYSKAFRIPIITHSEDENLVGEGVMNEGIQSNRLGLRGNPNAAEEIMIAREIALCRLTGCQLHIAHVSTHEGVEHIRRAKEMGLPVTAEVTPHHLCLSDQKLRTYDTCFKVAPPLRTERDVEACQKALSDGVLDLIASDHAPHAEIDKATEFDHACCGMLGLQTMAPITYELVKQGKLSLKRWLESLTTAPAKLLNLPHGNLKKGTDADLFLFDPKAEWIFTEAMIRSKSRNTPFLNRPLVGKVEWTAVGGKIEYEAKL